MNKINLLLMLIVILAFAIRIYKIDSVPPSLTWDEASVGYNAWTVAHFGKDEYGKSFPLFFESFGEDKQPVHVYITSFFVKILGLSEFSTRAPAAVFGALNVLLIFYLAKVLFNNNLVGLLSSLFLAFSPQNIHFSRFNHEINFALFFFMLGLLLFYRSLKKAAFLPMSVLSFALSIISYHAAEIVVPPLVLLLIFLYFKDLKKDKKILMVTSILVLILALIFISTPRLLGVARFNQTVQKEILLLGRVNLILTQYSWHFDPTFLFFSGDRNPRLSSQGAGEFYLIDALFLISGVIFLIFKRSKAGLVVLSWALIGPMPSSLVAEAPHAARAAFMMGSWQIIAALGFYQLINRFKSNIKWLLGIVLIIILIFSLAIYLRHYFTDFPKRYAIDWQYGMKQIVQYFKDNPQYNQVSMTDVRGQPYIFFLYYLKTPLPEFLNTVIYNNGESKSYNKVSSFNRYYFGGWNAIENTADKRVLYVLSPSEYDGLIYRSNFDIKKTVYYPNGSTAFFLVALK